MHNLSLVIVARNEERTIRQVLSAAAPLADEIIFVDSGSTDGTIDIAREFNAKVTHQDWLGYAAQKNFAMGLAERDWILSLDADEILTSDLVEEMKALLGSDRAKECDGYKIPRILYIGDTAIKHGGFYPDAQLRLVQRGKGQFNDRLVHEAIKVSGPVGQLHHAMNHYSYATVSDFAQAMEKYAALSAKEFARRKAKGWKTSPLNELIHPYWTLFYRFVLRGGFLDGALGWELNWIYSDYVRRKIRYLREVQNES